jgi:hypothetical protein
MIEKTVDDSYAYLCETIRVIGPIDVGSHKNFIVTGIADDNKQLYSLCWCILGFLDYVDEIEMKIESVIGDGTKARDNLCRILNKRFGVEKKLTESQKRLNRNPLIQEIIGHVLIHLHRRKPIFPEFLGDAIVCRNPHLSANDTGVDLIALASLASCYFPVIGEIKAYEKEPIDGFNIACEKFSQVRKGEYDDEIRGALKRLSIKGGVTNDDLANSIWVDSSKFGAIVGYDINYSFDTNSSCQKENVTEQNPSTLYLVSTSYKNMFGLFDDITQTLVALANSLGE